MANIQAEKKKVFLTGYCLELLPIHIKTKKTIEERNLDHHPIPKEEMKSIFENKFKREIVKLVVGHEHCKEDGYCHLSVLF